MAQKRLISPDFWTDRKIIGLSPFARLFYIGTWNYACDNGHILFDAFELKLKILPADAVDGEELVDELVSAERLERRVAADGKPYLYAPSLSTHQKSEKRWKSRCPVCRTSTDSDEPQPATTVHEETRQTSVEVSEPRENSPRGEGRGREVMRGEGRGETRPPRKCPEHLNDLTSPPCGACRDARLAREDWDRDHAEPAALPTQSRCERDGHTWHDGWCFWCETRAPEVVA